MSLRNSFFSELSLATAIWLRPARLAARTASSARRSRPVPLSRPGSAGGHADAHGSGDGLVPDGQAVVHRFPDPLGKELRGLGCHRLVRNDDELVATQPGNHAAAADTRCQAVGEAADEPVAGGVPERVVDRLQTVEIDVEDRDRAGLSRRETIREVGEQCPTVTQPGQIVVVGEMAKEFLGRHPGLELREQRSHGCQGVLRLRVPSAAAALDESERSGGEAS